MPYTTSYPLTKLWFPGPREHPTVIAIWWCSRVGSDLVRSLAIALLSNVYQEQQGCSQAEYD